MVPPPWSLVMIVVMKTTAGIMVLSGDEDSAGY